MSLKVFWSDKPSLSDQPKFDIVSGKLDYDYDYDDGDDKVFDSYQACPPTLVPWVRESYRQQ